MNVVEKLLERDILIEEETFARLSDDQMKQLETKIDTMSDNEVETFFQRGSVEIVRSYSKKPTKHTFQDFVKHFQKRLEQISGILRSRTELQNVQSITHLRKDQRASIIGIIWEIGETKSGHIMLTVEDRTGKIKVLLSKNRPELLELGKNLVLDEIVGITGLCAGDIVFADSVIIPDIPINNSLKKAPDDAHAVFISDLHFGNKDFFYDSFERFLSWLNGKEGDEASRARAKKVKYLFITGDLVEGVGIYPGQENDLSIIDIKEQYQEFSKHIDKIPDHIQIIMCPGNHEAGRLSEPQFGLYTDFAEEIINKQNIHMVSNPSYIRIHKSKDFEGFMILMYHGYSFIYYGNNVPSIFNEGGVNRPDLIMKYLLQKRHLAPSHTSNLYIPDPEEDPLVISEIPDFFISGHTHHTASDNYRGITMINCSCWVPITDNQLSYGLDCDPGKVPIVNLQTREVSFMTFEEEK